MVMLAARGCLILIMAIDSKGGFTREGPDLVCILFILVRIQSLCLSLILGRD